MTLAITRLDLTAEDLRRAARSSWCVAQARRCLAIASVLDAVCPQRGVGAGLVMPRADTEGLNAHLIEIARTVAPGAHAVLILDGAGWHKSDALVVPDTISLLILPPYAPELNPIDPSTRSG